VIFRKFLTGLLIICLLIILSGYILIEEAIIKLLLSDLFSLTIAFSAISIISVLIFIRGLNKDPTGRTMHLMVASTLKLLLEMFLALIWFLVVKKTYTASVLLFFILYLAISLYSTFFMLKTLKSRPL